MVKRWIISIGSLLGLGIILLLTGVLTQFFAIVYLGVYVFTAGFFLTGFCLVKYTNQVLAWRKQTEIKYFGEQGKWKPWWTGTDSMEAWYEYMEPGWYGIWKFFIRLTGLNLMIPLVFITIAGIVQLTD